MGRIHNKMRGKWQDYGSSNATSAEKFFLESFKRGFQGTDFGIRSKPKEFAKIYVDVLLSQEELQKIYNPEIPITRHGVSPDYAIDSKVTGKTIYVEVKRRDGWVEGGKKIRWEGQCS